ncbi:hypothetical protein D9756_001885 [Leucocoprinus leucothites]|uniref:F-box domain-containing protein n=1 Tax=Leucocoprinus leucothites TaxID=201217 RepID=A0A8H5G427_9AGAR|nr:hypothetical protein D9756_001885 [Leucoagaricus leucothites]
MSVPSSPQDGALARLPEEVLHNIFCLLKPWELLCLARVSERIQRVSLGIYYNRRGVDVSPTGIIDITREEDYDLLALLRITTFFTRTGHISVVFVFPKWSFMENIRNLTLILRRLVSLDMITLKFRFDPGTRIEEERRTALLTTEARSSEYKGLSKELRALFCTAFRVAGMVRILESEQLLEMVGGKLSNHFLVFPNTPVINRYKVAAKVRMNKIARLASRKRKEKEPEARHESSVVSLDIQSLVPLVPPLLSSTVICLNVQSKLRHLSFTTSSDDQVCWSPLLTNLRVPSLVELTMSSNSCTLSDLAKFVKRHLRVSILDIRDFAPMPMPTELPRVANFAFRNLISVTAPSEVLGVFLSYPTDVAPRLGEAHLAITITENRPFDLRRAWSALAPVVQRLQSLESFGLLVAYEAGESPFGKNLECEEKEKLVPLINVLTLRLQDDLEVDTFGPLTDWIMEFTQTRELKLQSVYPYPYPTQIFFTESAVEAEEEKKRKREAFRQELSSRLVEMEKLETCDIFGKRYP